MNRMGRSSPQVGRPQVLRPKMSWLHLSPQSDPTPAARPNLLRLDRLNKSPIPPAPVPVDDLPEAVCNLSVMEQVIYRELRKLKKPGLIVPEDAAGLRRVYTQLTANVKGKPPFALAPERATGISPALRGSASGNAAGTGEHLPQRSAAIQSAPREPLSSPARPPAASRANQPGTSQRVVATALPDDPLPILVNKATGSDGKSAPSRGERRREKRQEKRAERAEQKAVAVKAREAKLSAIIGDEPDDGDDSSSSDDDDKDHGKGS